MKISLKLHPNSSQEKIIKIDELNYEVWIREKPVENQANIYLEKYLKKCFKKKVQIVSGFTSKFKIIEIEE